MASVRGMIALYLRVALQYCDIHRNVPRYNDSEQDNFTHSPINASLPFEPVFNPDCMNQIFSVFTKEISNNGITPMQSALYSTIYALLTILGLGGNGLIILAVLRRRQMRRSRNFLIANLALSNFLLSSILYPLLWRPDQARFFPFGRFACKLGAAFPASNIYCSTLTIAAMAVERYQAIRKRCANRLAPRASHRESLFFLGLCLLIWLAALFLASPFIFFYDLAQQPPHLADIALADGTRADFSIGFCQLGPRLQQDGYLRLSMSINILQSTFLYLVPSLTLFIFNCRLSHYVSANSMAKAVSRRASAPQTAALIVSSSVQSGGQPSNLLAAPVAHNTTTLRQSSEDSTAVAFGSEMSGCVQLTPTRPSRAVRRRSKLRVLLGTMAGSYALLWLPYTLYVFMLDFGIVHGSSVSTWLDFSVKLISVLSVCANPLIYGFLNNNLRPELMDILCTPLVFFRRTSSPPPVSTLLNGLPTSPAPPSPARQTRSSSIQLLRYPLPRLIPGRRKTVCSGLSPSTPLRSSPHSRISEANEEESSHVLALPSASPTELNVTREVLL